MDNSSSPVRLADATVIQAHDHVAAAMHRDASPAHQRHSERRILTKRGWISTNLLNWFLDTGTQRGMGLAQLRDRAHHLGLI